MTTTTESKTETGFDVTWAARAAARAAERGEPGWARERRAAAAVAMRALSFPNREDELWRRTDFAALESVLPALDPFAATTPATALSELPSALRALLPTEADVSGLVLQRDGDVVFESCPASLAADGVIVCSMERAVREHGDKVQSLLGAQLADGTDWYVAAAAALRSGGAFVWVPDGVEAKLPIRIVQWFDRGGVLAAPRTVVAIGRGARATVLDEQHSPLADPASLHLGGTEVFVADDAKLVYATLQDWGRNVFHYSNHRASVGRNAELQWIQTMLGARMAKSHAYYDLVGPGAQAFVHGFVFGDEKQHFHLHTLQRHKTDHTTSDLLIKCCLKDRARSVYQGLIQVSEGAQRTDAYQANRNLLLSETARADSIPGLEILANDVRCTHGATIGTVDSEQMYYLQSRGLPANEAQRLIVEGFFAPVLDRIPLERVREGLRDVIEQKIG